MFQSKIIDRMLVFIVLFVLLLVAGGKNALGMENEEHLVCSDDFCDAYVTKNPCPDIDESCLGTNSSKSGELFPSPTPCNCCKLCMAHLKEGEFCSLGAPGAPVPSFICSPGLQCRRSKSEDDPKCLPIADTLCIKEQTKYDQMKADGTVGQFIKRPICDEDGNYKSTKCIPGQLCYCVDKEGERIFGESFHTASAEASMNCGCARISSTLNGLLKSEYPQYSIRCQDNGSFDPMYCVNGKCVCMDSTHGTLRGTRVYSETGGMDKLPCFNRLLHRNQTYLHECESTEMAKVSELLKYEDEGYHVLPEKIKICDPNGWYSRVQENTDTKFCADKYGKQLEQFQVGRFTEAAQNMNCNCARTRNLLKNKNYAELPVCCPNGNFQRIGCRRGYCYCVDENGNQISQDVREDERNALSCYNNGILC